MGLGGYVTYDELKNQFYNNELHQVLYILNDVYAYQMQEYFSTVSSAENAKISNLRNKINRLLFGLPNDIEIQNEVYLRKYSRKIKNH